MDSSSLVARCGRLACNCPHCDPVSVDVSLYDSAVSARDLVLVVVIIGVATVVQGVSGFGFSLASMPLLASLLGVHRALAIQTTLGIASNASTALRSRSHILKPTAARILIASVLGMPLGWVLLDHINGRDLKLGVGITVGLLALLLALHVHIRSTGHVVDYVSGFFSGVLSTSTGTNGPPLVIGLSGRRLPATQQRATLSTCFAISNVIVFTALLWNGRIDRPVVTAVSASLPVLLLSSAIGHRLFEKLNQHHYERIVIGLLFASAGVAVVSALLADNG